MVGQNVVDPRKVITADGDVVRMRCCTLARPGQRSHESELVIGSDWDTWFPIVVEQTMSMCRKFSIIMHFVTVTAPFNATTRPRPGPHQYQRTLLLKGEKELFLSLSTRRSCARLHIINMDI